MVVPSQYCEPRIRFLAQNNDYYEPRIGFLLQNNDLVRCKDPYFVKAPHKLRKSKAALSFRMFRCLSLSKNNKP